MSAIFIGRGDCRLGMTRIDKNGKVTEQSGNQTLRAAVWQSAT